MTRSPAGDLHHRRDQLGLARPAATQGIGSDSTLAAISVADGFAVATRDNSQYNSPFDAAGVSVINPWAPA